MKRGALPLIAALGLAACGPSGGGSAADTPPPEPTWTYSVNVDEMRNERTYWAMLESSNAPELEFPYAGGSPVTLQIYKVEGDPPDNYPPRVQLQNGQFNCHGGSSYNSCYVAVKFDDAEPRVISAFEEECGKFQCLRFSWLDLQAGDVRSLIPDLRKAQTVVIELPLYNFGSYQYRFHTAGLDWADATDRQ